VRVDDHDVAGAHGVGLHDVVTSRTRAALERGQREQQGEGSKEAEVRAQARNVALELGDAVGIAHGMLRWMNPEYGRDKKLDNTRQNFVAYRPRCTR